MSRMHNPAHPGAVLREYLGDTSVTEAATALGITRTALDLPLYFQTPVIT